MIETIFVTESTRRDLKNISLQMAQVLLRGNGVQLDISGLPEESQKLINKLRPNLLRDAMRQANILVEWET